MPQQNASSPNVPIGSEVMAEIVSLKKQKGWFAIVAGSEAFLPLQRGAPNYRKRPQLLIGSQISCLVRKIWDDGTLELSEIEIWERERDARLRLFLETVSVGSTVTGLVAKVVDYGVFVDFGGFCGLLHVSEIVWGRTPKPKKLFKAGVELELLVLDISLDTNPPHISLSLKRMKPDPWKDFVPLLSIGQEVRGVVTNVARFGAFVALTEGVEGLIHASNVGPVGMVNDAKQVLTSGQVVQASVVGIDWEKQRISLKLLSSFNSASP
jgi:small subunit ribosomal protein S1